LLYLRNSAQDPGSIDRQREKRLAHKALPIRCGEGDAMHVGARRLPLDPNE
jgi:hypothetical protein